MNDTSTDPNPPYGQRGGFRKLTVTLPQEVYERLILESAKRRIAGSANQLFSEMLREALTEYFERLDGVAVTEEKATDGQ